MLTSSVVHAAGPAWWTNDVLKSGVTTNDFAAVNQGQVKNVSYHAYLEMETKLLGGAGSNVTAMINSFSPTNNYRAVNVGQLKNLAKVFYDRLIETGYTNAYPWTTTTADDKDHAIANIGQVKRLFDWSLP
jgi:hypothetical protein